MYFDRFDICEAYYLYVVDWNIRGVTNRWYNTSRRYRQAQSINAQLFRMKFRPRLLLWRDTDLTENGLEIYNALIEKWE